MRSLIVTLMLASLVLPAGASEFCGGNGVMTLSFTPLPDVTPTTSMKADDNGLVMVDVYLSLGDVHPAEGPGGVMLALGGFECELRVTGAETLSVQKKILVPHRDFGQRPTQVWVGVSTAGERVDKGPLALVKWTVMFQGRPENVRFDLDPAGLLSCSNYPCCGDAGTTGIYVGAIDVAQEGFLFGTGCAPAYLNPVGEPDLAVVPCTLGVDEAGVFKLRK